MNRNKALYWTSVFVLLAFVSLTISCARGISPYEAANNGVKCGKRVYVR